MRRWFELNYIVGLMALTKIESKSIKSIIVDYLTNILCFLPKCLLHVVIKSWHFLDGLKLLPNVMAFFHVGPFDPHHTSINIFKASSMSRFTNETFIWVLNPTQKFKNITE